MGAGASVVWVAEKECKMVMKDCFDADAFRSVAQGQDNKVSLKELQAVYQNKNDVIILHDESKDIDHVAGLKQISQGLTSRGLKVWVDVENPEGNVQKNMTKAVENSFVAIIVVTQLLLEQLNDPRMESLVKTRFDYTLRSMGRRRCCCVLYDQNAQDKRFWLGDIGYLLWNNAVVDLCDRANMSRGLDELYDSVLALNRTTLRDVNDFSVWQQALAKIQAEKQREIEERLNARESVLQEELELWFFSHTTTHPNRVEAMVAALLEAGVGSVDKLKKKLEKNAGFMTVVMPSITADEVDEISSLLIAPDSEPETAPMGARRESTRSERNFNDYKNVYDLYLEEFITLNSSAKELEATAKADPDANRCMLARALLALATAKAHTAKPLKYGKQALPWLRRCALTEEEAPAQQLSRPFALTVQVTAVLGAFLLRGVGSAPQDEAAALQRLHVAAMYGNPMAQHQLGHVLKSGRHTSPEVEKEAILYCTLAAEQGQPEAALDVALAYYGGRGVERDFVESMKWFQEAARLGLPKGLYELGFINYCGGFADGHPPNFPQAFEMFQASHNKGYPKAASGLAMCYAFGLGVEKDATRAKKLAQEAVENGVQSAKKLLHRLSLEN